MRNRKRNVNKKLFRELLAYYELDLKKVGQQCDPPVTKAAISMLVNRKTTSARLVRQVSDILNAASDVLFPMAEPLGGKGIVDGEIADITIALGDLGLSIRTALDDTTIDTSEKIQIRAAARKIKQEVDQLLDAAGIIP